MSVQLQCPILSVSHLNPHAIAITVYAGALARTARPGQFIHVRCGEGLLLRRPISICSVEGDSLSMVFEVRGEGTAWLARRSAGEQLDLLGPLGNGFAPEEGKLLLVGGGIGIPPLLWVAQSAPGRCHAVLGFRDRDHAMLIEEFEAVCASVTVTTDDGSLGSRGYVDRQIDTALRWDGSFAQVMACGPKAMLRAVSAVATACGVPCQVSMEERMGCGVGACLVCACQMTDGTYRHVCKDGPVFDCREVTWDV